MAEPGVATASGIDYRYRRGSPKRRLFGCPPLSLTHRPPRPESREGHRTIFRRWLTFRIVLRHLSHDVFSSTMGALDRRRRRAPRVDCLPISHNASSTSSSKAKARSTASTPASRLFAATIPSAKSGMSAWQPHRCTSTSLGQEANAERMACRWEFGHHT